MMDDVSHMEGQREQLCGEAQSYRNLRVQTL